MDSLADEDETTIYESVSEDLLQEGEEAEASEEANVIRDKWNQMLRFYSFDESLGESTGDSMKTELELVTDFIEIKSRSCLKHFYINVLSSRIKRSKTHRKWEKLFTKELKLLKDKINTKYIVLYLDNVIPAFNRECLIDEIENEYKSKLKTYIQMRNDKVKSEKECNILIEREWDILNSKIEERFICAYYAIFFGNPLIN